MYSEYQIRKSFIAVLNKALEDMDVSGYKVIARNQPTMTHDYDCVIVDKVSMRQEGWQSHRIVKGYDEGGKRIIVKRQEWLETWTWQISVTHRRSITDTVESLTGEDVANRLRVWLDSGMGADVMRHMEDVPFAPFQVFDMRLRPYKDDSDINQVESTFDFKMNVVQFRDTEPIAIEGWEAEVHGI